MRIQAITETNTRQKQNPYLAQDIDHMTLGKSAALVSFEECLKSQMQNATNPSVTGRGEWMVTSSMWGYFMAQEVANKSETKLKENAQ